MTMNSEVRDSRAVLRVRVRLGPRHPHHRAYRPPRGEEGRELSRDNVCAHAPARHDRNKFRQMNYTEIATTSARSVIDSINEELDAVTKSTLTSYVS